MGEDGTRLVADRYELGELIGSGGAGAVWRGRDRRLDRTVAIKEVRFPSPLDEEDQERRRTRVRREARAAGRLSHPSVTTVYDAVEEDGHAYIVMELVEAPTLADLVRQEGPLPPARAAQVGADILGALRAAHRQGVIHRDVKPSNVLVPATGVAKLTDFGIAAAVDDPSITGTGAVVGSPAFMAPEQARDGDRTAASDLYSLGATLFFALEGRPPFDRGGTIATVTAVVNEPPPPLRHAGPLAELVTALLAKAPTDRPVAAEVAERLGDVAAPSPPPSPTALPARSPADRGRVGEDDDPAPAPADRPRRRPAALAAIALLLLGGLVIWNLLGDGDGDGPEDLAAPAPADPQDDDAPGAEPDAPDTDAAEDTGPDGDAEPPVEPEAPTPDDDGDEGGEGDEDDAADGSGEGAGDDAVGVDAAPQSWSVHTDAATGYRVAHPPEWEVVPVSETLTDFRDPGSRTYLRVDWTDEPSEDPVADWQQQSQAFGADREGYEELRVEPVDWRGFDAALWEYRYVAEGAPVRAYNLGIDTGTYGHALNLQAAEDDWDDVQELWEVFNQTFEPGG